MLDSGQTYSLEALHASIDCGSVVSLTVAVDQVSYAVTVFATIVLYKASVSRFVLAMCARPQY